MLNDPFWLTREQAEALTDRQAHEWYLGRYEPTPADEWALHVDAQIVENERLVAEKTLAQRKSDYWAMCAEFGCSSEEIERSWQEYLKTGTT